MANEVEVDIDVDASDAVDGLADVDRAGERTASRWSRIGSRMGATWDRIGSTFARGASRMGGQIQGALGDSVSGAFQAMPPQAQAAVAAAAVTLAVMFSGFLAAAISAGILLALGGGVIALGIKAAMSDPAIQNTFEGFKARAKEATSGFADAFKGPVQRAILTLGDGIANMSEQFTKMGTTMAPVIDKLMPALMLMAQKAMPGIQSALSASIPLFEKLAEWAPALGAAFSSFFSSIADGSEGATTALDVILQTVVGFIVVLGKVIGWLSQAFQFLHSAAGTVLSWMMSALSAAGSAWGMFKNACVSAVNIAVNVLGYMVVAAAHAFGWIPGIGPQLRAAAAGFLGFRNSVNNALAGIQDETVNVTAIYRGGGTTRGDDLAQRGSVKFRASGGIAGGMVGLNELGTELVKLPQGSMVTTAASAGNMLDQLGGSGGKFELIVSAEPNADPTLMDAIIRGLRLRISGLGGNVQTSLGKS